MPHRTAKEKLTLLEKIQQREPLTPYKNIVRSMKREDLQATRDVFRAPIAGKGSLTYEEWIMQDPTRDRRGLEALNIIKSELAARKFLDSKGLPSGPLFRRDKPKEPGRG